MDGWMDGWIHYIHEMIWNTNRSYVNEQRNITKGQGDEWSHCCDTFFFFFVRPCYFALWLKCHQTTWCVVCPPFLFALTQVAITWHLSLRCTWSHMSWLQLQAEFACSFCTLCREENSIWQFTFILLLLSLRSWFTTSKPFERP